MVFPVCDYAKTQLATAFVRYNDEQNRRARAESEQIPPKVAKRATQLLCSGHVQKHEQSIVTTDLHNSIIEE